RRAPPPTPFPYTTLFRSAGRPLLLLGLRLRLLRRRHLPCLFRFRLRLVVDGGPPRGAFGGEEHRVGGVPIALAVLADEGAPGVRSEEHTSELQSRENLVC